MNLRSKSCLRAAAVASALLLVCVVTAWFYAPTRVESIDRLTYCACGYSTVRFNDGKITMVKHFHSSVKPGQQIGTYRVVGDKIKLEIVSKTQTYQETFALDNVGLVNSRPYLPLRYYATNSKSTKTYIYFAYVQLRAQFIAWWQR